MQKFLTGVLATGLCATAPLGFAQTDDATLDELRRIIERQQQQLEQQARSLEALRRQVEGMSQNLEAASVASDGDVLAKAQPRTMQSGSDRVKLTLSGQVNRGLLFIDDGEETETFNVDNDNSSTRVRLVGEARPSEDFAVGANIEVQFESNSTAAVNQDDQRNVGPNNFTERKLELYFDHARYGKLSLGQGDMASNGSAEVDLSGTGVIGYSGVADLAGGVLFRADDGELTGIAIGRCVQQSGRPES